MKCAEARTSLQLELDGELPAAEERALSGHLVACAECRRLRQDLAAVADWPRREPDPSAARVSLVGPVVAAIRAQRRGHALRRILAAASFAAAALLWAVVLPGLLDAPVKPVPGRAPSDAGEQVPPESSIAEASVEMLHEWKIYNLSARAPEPRRPATTRVERERRTVRDLLRPRPICEKPGQTAERMRAVREAAAVAAAEMGARGAALLEEAARDPRRAPEVLAGVTGHARAELLPVFIAAMRHRRCRPAAEALAAEATGLNLGGNPAKWRAWWERRLGGRGTLSPFEAAAGLGTGKPSRPPVPESGEKKSKPSAIA